MLWDDAKMCILMDRLDLFKRKKEVLEKYQEYIRAVNENGTSVREIILKKAMGKPIAWTRNEFPYDVEGASHYLIWSVTPLSDERIRDIAGRRAAGKEFVTFVNPDHLRSVKDLWHAHVLIKLTS